MAKLELKNIKKSFGDAHILKGIDLEINDGEFVVFVGPSGCGKSTLLRLIAGLEVPTGGDIFIDDKVGRGYWIRDTGSRSKNIIVQDRN